MKKLVLLFLIVIPFLSLKADVEWVKTNGPLGGFYRDYCATKDRVFICMGYDRIYYSTDDGLNWVLTGPMPVKAKYSSKSFKVDNRNRVFFTDDYSFFLYDQSNNVWIKLNLKLDSTAEKSTKNLFALKDTLFLSIMDNGLYKLSNDLSTCTLVYSYTNNTPFKNLSTLSCNSGNTFFAVFGSGIAYSKNYGLTWDSVKIFINARKHLTQNGDVYSYDKNFYKLNTSTFKWDTVYKQDSVKIYWQYLSSDNNGNIYYIGDYPLQLYRSTDNGKSWKLFKKAKVCNDAIEQPYFVNVTTVNNKTYINDERILWFSQDKGTKWRIIDSPEYVSYKPKITLIFPLDDDRVFVLSEFGLFRTMNKGLNYQSAFIQCSTDYKGYDKIIKRGGWIYGTVFNNNFMSDDEGDTWTLDKWIYGYTRNFDADNNGTLYYSSNYGFRKTNNWGITIDTIEGNLPKDKKAGNIRVSGFCINDNYEILVALNDGGIYKSKDGGKIWIQKMDTNFKTSSFYRSGDHVAFYTNDKIFKSTDFGETWTMEDSKLPLNWSNYYVAPNGYHYVIVISPAGSGIFQSTDGGSNWKKITINFDPKLITAYAITPDNTMWVGTDSGYVYHTQSPIVSVQEEFISDDSFLISPNPATDYIEISVGANGRSPLQSEIKIYNVFGQSITTVNLTPTLSILGEGVRLDVSALVPGMYFVKVGDRVGKFVKL